MEPFFCIKKVELEPPSLAKPRQARLWGDSFAGFDVDPVVTLLGGPVDALPPAVWSALIASGCVHANDKYLPFLFLEVVAKHPGPGLLVVSGRDDRCEKQLWEVKFANPDSLIGQYVYQGSITY